MAAKNAREAKFLISNNDPILLYLLLQRKKLQSTNKLKKEPKIFKFLLHSMKSKFFFECNAATFKKKFQFKTSFPPSSSFFQGGQPPSRKFANFDFSIFSNF